jgi:hypothetical protein
MLAALLAAGAPAIAQDPPARPLRLYENRLQRITHPKPLLADFPEYFEPIIEQAHFEAPAIVTDDGGFACPGLAILLQRSRHH